MEDQNLELELIFLQEKMKEAITYQFYFGNEEEDKIERASKNCALIVKSFLEKKLQNVLNKA